MGLTVLQLIQAACYETNIQVPTTLVGTLQPSVSQLLNLFYATGRELRKARTWPQLKKQFTVYVQAGRSEYNLPKDFYSALPMTHWDQGNKWQMLGPMTDMSYDLRLYGYVTLENRISYRVFGPDINPNSGQGQIMINPTPGEDVNGNPFTFEYISQSWLLSPNWAPSTSYGANLYVNSSGNVYQKGAGTATSGTVPPNMNYGEGQDGGVFWLALTTAAWAATTVYLAGAYVTNGGNLYQCISGGTSAGAGGPSGTGESITDGTVTWIFRAVSSWTGATGFAFGDHILIGAQYYRCVTPGTQGVNESKTGSVQPTWTTTTVSDGLIIWTFKDDRYDTIQSDTDLCLFDDEIMIAGLKYRFLLARGLQYQEHQREYELMKDTAVSRWNAGKKISLHAGDVILSGLNPNIPEGGYG